MNTISNYISFTKEKGISLSVINPGSNEFALNISDSFKAVDLLKDTQTAIVGGDILSDNAGKLIYAYQLWGSKYHYLNWSCDKLNNESQIEYINRSYNVAKESINKAAEIAMQLGSSCYIVIVT